MFFDSKLPGFVNRLPQTNLNRLPQTNLLSLNFWFRFDVDWFFDVVDHLGEAILLSA